MAFAPAVTDQSANYFARYAERRQEQQSGGTTASASGRTPQTRAIEAQAKAADRDTAEEAKRLRQVLVGHGLPKGQAESMSVGELKGTLDTWTMKHARHLEAEKMKQLQQQQEFENQYRTDDLKFRQEEARAGGEAKRAKAQADSEALAREQAALQSAAMEGAIQSGQGGYQGPLQPPSVTPAAAAGRAYLRGGGMDAGQLRAMGEVFTPPKQLSEPRVLDVNGYKVMDLGNGNRHVLKPEEEPEPVAYFPSLVAANAALKETNRMDTHMVVPLGKDRYTIRPKTGQGQAVVTQLLTEVLFGGGRKREVSGPVLEERSGEARPPTPTPTPTPISSADFLGVPPRR